MCDGTHCAIKFIECGDTGTNDPGGGGGSGGTDPGDPHPARTTYIPACPGNRPDENESLCTGAANSCPSPRASRYWRYVKEWVEARQAYGRWVRQDGTVCVEPEDLGDAVDPLVAVAAAVRSDWKSYGLPAAAVTTLPGGQTLVQATTQLTTRAPLTATIGPKTVLGYPVTLAITATTFGWRFGDGSSSELPVSESARTVSHVYRQAGPMTVSLTTSYTATYTIVGTAVRGVPLEGVGVVPGPATALLAREARAQLRAD